MDRRIAEQDSARMLGVTLVLWGATVTMGAVEGVFAKLPPAVLVAVALFALVFAPASVLLDRTLREYLARVDARVLSLAAVALAAFGIATAIGPDGRFDAAPGAVAIYFVVPVLAALLVAAIDRALDAPRAARSAPAKSPGATPAAT